MWRSPYELPVVQFCITCKDPLVSAALRAVVPASVPDVASDDPSPASGLRERKKRQRREALIDAAQALVLERGLDAVTVEEISEAVGVSTRTFFNYFPGKDDAVLGLGDFGIGSAARTEFLAGGPTGRLLDDVEVLVADLISGPLVSPERIGATLELACREPRLLQRHMSWIEEHRVQLQELFERRRATHPFVPEPELLAVVAMALLRATTLEWERRDRGGSPADLLPGVVVQLRALLGD